MSIRLMTMVWDIPFPTQAQKLIALKMADYASDTGGSVFPSAETLGEKAGCDERTVQRTLKVFRDCGLIHLVREGGKGPKDTNEWWLNVPMLAALAYGQATISGSSACIEIDGQIGDATDENKGDTAPPIKGDTKGDTLSPLDPKRVTPVSLRVTQVSAKGDTGVTQSVTNHQDPSRARERASDEGARALRAEGKPAIAIEIRTGEAAFQSWVDHLHAIGQTAVAEAATASGTMTVPSRWPKEGSAMPKVATPARLTEQSRRMTGDAS